MFDDRYTLETAMRLANPQGVRGVIRHVGLTLNQKYHRRFVDPGGVDVMEADWDNLLILDGCRYDLFHATCDLAGELESCRSRASDSNGFIQRNFVDRSLHDTVYVTGNPYANGVPDGTFHHLRNLLDDGWDEAMGTVRPETVAEAAIEAREQFPRKRLVAHFMQPHYPFIGPRGQELQSGRIEPGRSGPDFGHTIWQQLKYGLTELSEEDVWSVYTENLEIVLETVDELLYSINGKTVITADHGNLVGDRLNPIPVRGYGHPPDLYVDPLIVVPWFTIDGERREVEADPPVDSEHISEAALEGRLTALGYR